MFKVFQTPEFRQAISFLIEGIQVNKKSLYIYNISDLNWCLLVIIKTYLINKINLLPNAFFWQHCQQPAFAL